MPVLSSRQPLVKDTNGNIITMETDHLKLWKEHFSLLLLHPPVPIDPSRIITAHSAATNNTCRLDPVTPLKTAALKKLNDCKAPGTCTFSVVMLKVDRDNMVQWLTCITNCVWVSEQLPNDCTQVLSSFSGNRRATNSAATTGASPSSPSQASSSLGSSSTMLFPPSEAVAAHNKPNSCQINLPPTIFLPFISLLKDFGSSTKIATFTSSLSTSR
uniref:Uncharacterized protein n=1 Tax=Octopus bimaculoides TaxID=37653 RepID=A0A0L8G7Y2_OCTBM